MCCAAGMSTSLLVQRMEKAAEKQGYECHIEAVPYSPTNKKIEDADVILLGPQVRFNLKDVKEKFPRIPSAVIEMRTYGMCDGEGILKQAQELLGD